MAEVATRGGGRLSAPGEADCVRNGLAGRMQARSLSDVGYEVSLKAWRRRLKEASLTARNTEGSHDRTTALACA